MTEYACGYVLSPLMHSAHCVSVAAFKQSTTGVSGFGFKSVALNKALICVEEEG